MCKQKCPREWNFVEFKYEIVEYESVTSKKGNKRLKVINVTYVQTGSQFMDLWQSKMADFYKKWGWPPERVANAILKAVQKNRGVVPVGPEAWLFWYFKRLSQPLWQLYLKLSAKLAL